MEQEYSQNQNEEKEVRMISRKYFWTITGIIFGITLAIIYIMI